MHCSKDINYNHKCYKNWENSSPEMEGWIIREGFEYLKNNHNYAICKYIADADSHTYSLLKTLEWGD